MMFKAGGPLIFWELQRESKMDESLIGSWVEIELTNGKKWVGKLEEWDEDAIYINNGFDFGDANHKGAECTNDEASTILPTTLREFSVE